MKSCGKPAAESSLAPPEPALKRTSPGRCFPSCTKQEKLHYPGHRAILLLHYQAARPALNITNLGRKEWQAFPRNL